MSCYNATIQCPNIDSIGITFGYSIPTGPLTGTIVMFSSGSGTSPTEYADENLAYASSCQSTYIVIQLEYIWPWEYPYQSTGQPGNILNSACRPATFLSWVNSNLALHTAGRPMCVQATSAGAGAAAYSLAWYGASSFISTLELLSGPTLTQIDQGCAYPKGMDSTICGSANGVKQYGCTSATNSWTDNPIYVSFYKDRVSQWTGLSGCALPGNSGNLPAWAAMSIVDGSSGTITPTFSYPNTHIHGWLCATSNPCNDGACPNNSAAEGNDFYSKFTSAGNPNFKLTGIKGCIQEEGVAGGTDPDTGDKGSVAVTLDMQASCQ
jgi:hypothetical protein